MTWDPDKFELNTSTGVVKCRACEWYQPLPTRDTDPNKDNAILKVLQEHEETCDGGGWDDVQVMISVRPDGFEGQINHPKIPARGLVSYVGPEMVGELPKSIVAFILMSQQFEVEEWALKYRFWVWRGKVRDRFGDLERWGDWVPVDPFGPFIIAKPNNEHRPEFSGMDPKQLISIQPMAGVIDTEPALDLQYVYAAGIDRTHYHPTVLGPSGPPIYQKAGTHRHEMPDGSKTEDNYMDQEARSLLAREVWPNCKTDVEGVCDDLDADDCVVHVKGHPQCLRTEVQRQAADGSGRPPVDVWPPSR